MKAILYARFSPRPGAAECESIQTQLERMRALCLAKAWSIGAEHNDEAASGARADNRPGLLAALEAACKLRRGGVLLVYSLSRLARNTRDALAISARLERAGASLVSLHESIDTTTPAGRLFFTIMAAMAAWEREVISERTSDAMLRHQSAGRVMGSVAPYGWRMAGDGRLEEDPAEQEVVKQARRLREDGLGARRIGKHLEACGLLPRNGGKWQPSVIASMIGRKAPESPSGI